MKEKKQTAVEYCCQQINHFKDKSDHNKSEALWCFRLIMLGTLLAPLFVTLGTEVWTSKIIPSLLSVLAAFCTAWLQLRKPQELWSLYRTAQRELENHAVKHQHCIEEYKSSNEPDKLLVESIAKLSLNTHKKWVPTVPNPESLPKEKSLDKGK